LLDLSEVHVVSLPMRVPFRGVQHREALLLRGPAGWGEFAPFLEYDDAESARWLAAALEASQTGWPAPVRSTVPVNATIPAVAPGQVAAVLARFPGCTTAKVKVGQAGQALRDDVERVAAVRDLLGPARSGPGGRQRRLDAGRRALGDRRAGAVRPGVRRAALRHGRRPGAAAGRTGLDRAGRAGRCGRERAQGQRPAARGARRRGRPAGAQGGAARRCAAGAGDRGGVRPAGRGLQRAGHLRRHPGRRRAGRRAADLPYACGLATTSLLGGDVVRDSLHGHGGRSRWRS
jgi:O-succinylbenzoate synthase